ncbi:Geranylgeranyl transferase type-2 subunit alpha 1 [Camellia lanceoleosa]|uniref:Geranylgeranyl transferase type-2 subunit alpha 1 n=1 Tax=Camellia lanceoleosa TaxID=1840588 RepID=A0ACC0FY92_9ERIC|nr:Geranylgeranyl transferase type-2 subunit alpha 1 [Camellia lanceoleosa]
MSYNEIGAHAVDKRRYSCSSPLSHIVGSDWNFGEFVISGVNVTNYWEAFAIFKDSKLTQLDIIGNVVAEEEFKLFPVYIYRCPKSTLEFLLNTHNFLRLGICLALEWY